MFDTNFVKRFLVFATNIVKSIQILGGCYMKNNNEIGERVRKARQFLGLTQAEFSSKIGISRSHLSNIENGNEFPSHSVVLLMSAIFPIDLYWLQSGTGEMISDDTKEEITKNNNDFEKMLKKLKETFYKDCPYWMQGEFTSFFYNFKRLFELCYKNNNDNPIIASNIICFLSCMLDSDSKDEFRKYKYKIIAELDDIILDKKIVPKLQDDI